MDAASRRSFRRSLISWYRRNGRDLPWRRSADPYRIWISEVMLQQTTVAAVVPYYERFFARFPDVASLARANEEDVLKLWEGLGYYSRARNLHRAARAVLADLDGQFPSEVEQLTELPGIGRYTAGAIASFAFDQPAPIVEANTQRLYARLIGYEGDPRSAEGQAKLWQFAAEILPRRQPGLFNQALMDLGALVCTPRQPDCPSCPVRTACRAFQTGQQEAIPQLRPRPAFTAVTHAAALIDFQGRWLLRQYSSGERWAGLWDFPRCEVPSATADADALAPSADQLRSQASALLSELTGLSIQCGDWLGEIRHTVTRYKIQLQMFRGVLVSPSSSPNAPSLPVGTQGALAWRTASELDELPLSTTGRKMARFVQSLSLAPSENPA